MPVRFQTNRKRSWASSLVSDGTAEVVFHVEVVSSDLTRAEEIADQIRLSLMNFSGSWGSYTIGVILSEGDSCEVGLDDQTEQYKIVYASDYRVYFVEQKSL